MHSSEPAPRVDDPMDLLRRAQFFFEALPPMMVEGAEHSIQMPEVLEAIRDDFDLCVEECQHGLANSAGEERHGYELVAEYLEVQRERFKVLLVAEVRSIVFLFNLHRVLTLGLCRKPQMKEALQRTHQ